MRRRLPRRTAHTHRPPARLTIWTTPVVSTVLRWLSVALLRLTGWRIDGSFPTGGGYVVVVAPHSTYWDGVFMPAAAAQLRISPHWFGTQGLFWGPLGPLVRWFGAIPVDRSQRTSLVDAAIEAFAERPDLVLALAPEGTRYEVDHWKSGFYRIALGAGVPVVPGAIHYPRKRIVIGAPIALTGNPETDMATLRAFYDGKAGRRRGEFDPDGIRLNSD